MRKHWKFYLRVAGIWFNHAYMEATTVQGRWVLENSDIFLLEYGESETSRKSSKAYYVWYVTGAALNISIYLIIHL